MSYYYGAYSKSLIFIVDLTLEYLALIVELHFRMDQFHESIEKSDEHYLK